MWPIIIGVRLNVLGWKVGLLNPVAQVLGVRQGYTADNLITRGADCRDYFERAESPESLKQRPDRGCISGLSFLARVSDQASAPLPRLNRLVCEAFCEGWR